MQNKILRVCTTRREKDQMQELINISQPLLQAIVKLIEKDLVENDKVDWEDFKSPSWALERAAKDGFKKGLTKLKEYVTINDVKD